MDKRYGRALGVMALALTLGVSGANAAAATTAKHKPAGHRTAPGQAGKLAKPAKPLAVSAASLASLAHQLDIATAAAQRTGDAVLKAAAESASLGVNQDDIAAQEAQAQAQLNLTAVQAYEEAPPQGLPDLESLVIDPGEMQGLVDVGSAQAGTDRDSIAEATTETAKLAALTANANAVRQGLVAQAATVYTAQDTARALIATMQTALIAQAKAAASRASRAAAAAKLAQLAAAKAALDLQSSQLSLAVSPALTQAGRDALTRQQPLLATLITAGSGYPAGYHPTGQTLTGVSSWYGPGFVGRDTASGTPYDPELLTCAMLTVPLGTVIRVTNLANNVAVDVMVTDRGPYVGNRIIDLSHAAAVAIGNTGLATVRIEILAPGS